MLSRVFVFTALTLFSVIGSATQLQLACSRVFHWEVETFDISSSVMGTALAFGLEPDTLRALVKNSPRAPLPHTDGTGYWMIIQTEKVGDVRLDLYATSAQSASIYLIGKASKDDSLMFFSESELSPKTDLPRTPETKLTVAPHVLAQLDKAEISLDFIKYQIDILQENVVSEPISAGVVRKTAVVPLTINLFYIKFVWTNEKDKNSLLSAQWTTKQEYSEFLEQISRSR